MFSIIKLTAFHAGSVMTMKTVLKTTAAALAVGFASLVVNPGAGNATDANGKPSPDTASSDNLITVPSAPADNGGHHNEHDSGKLYLVLSSAFSKTGEREGNAPKEGLLKESAHEENSRGTNISPGVGFEYANPFFAKIGEGGARLVYTGGMLYNSGEKIPAGYAGVGLEVCTSMKETFATCVFAAGELEISRRETTIITPRVGPGIKVEYNPWKMFVSAEYGHSLRHEEPSALIFHLGKEF